MKVQGSLKDVMQRFASEIKDEWDLLETREDGMGSEGKKITAARNASALAEIGAVQGERGAVWVEDCVVGAVGSITSISEMA
jgi:coenzyme F420-reducing hydrogenase beta subunit